MSSHSPKVVFSLGTVMERVRRTRSSGGCGGALKVDADALEDVAGYLFPRMECMQTVYWAITGNGVELIRCPNGS